MSEVQNNQEIEDIKKKPNDNTFDGEGLKEDEVSNEDTEVKIEPETGTEIIEEASIVEEMPETEGEDESEDEDQIILLKSEYKELKKKADECESLLDKLLRIRADFTNYQKRMGKEKEDIRQFAVQNLILDLLPELDNFERAIKLAEDAKNVEKFVEGIKLIEDQLFRVLGKYGVKAIETENKPFDPNLHEAVFEEENNDLPHHTVIETFQRGFYLKDRVVRPSKVKVSKRSIDDNSEKEKENETETEAETEKSEDNSTES